MMNTGINSDVDKDGIRLAPQPIQPSGTYQMPQVRQEFVIEPRLSINDKAENTPMPSTASDFQPRKVDINKRWKRGKRGRNIFCGIVMLLMSVAVILPYALSAAGVTIAELPWKFIMTEFNAIGNIIKAVELTIELGGSGELVNLVWTFMVPSMILTIGLLFVVFNMINSLFGIFGAVKPRRCSIFSMIYLLLVLAIFIASLVGAEAIGIVKIDFMQDFIYGFKTSEMFGLLVFALGNFIFSVICQLINPVRTGYTR